MEEWVNLISNLGFPIAVCIYLFWQNSKLTDTLGELKLVISKLVDRFDKISDDDLK